MSDPICPCCSSNRFAQPLATDGGMYVTCRDCHSAFQSTRFETSEATVSKFEDAQERFYGDGAVMLSPAYEAMQRVTTLRRVREIRRVLSSGSLFEVGPGNGSVLALLRSQGFEVEAVEHSQVLANTVAQSTGAKIWHGDFNTLDIPGRYDAYMSFHVIEHVPDFVAHLQKAAAITRAGGYAFIATPNVESWEHKVARGLAPSFSTAHLQLFSRAGLELALKRAGWQLVRTSTPEYPIAWLRVMTAFLRKARGAKAAAPRGAYANAAGQNLVRLVKAAAFFGWPLRKLQELTGYGDELFVVARKL